MNPLTPEAFTSKLAGATDNLDSIKDSAYLIQRLLRQDRTKCKRYIFARAIGIHNKMAVAMHFFEIISLNQNADISIFFEKNEGEDISSQISLDFAFTY